MLFDEKEIVTWEKHNRAYNPVYLEELMYNVGELFADIQAYLPGIDVKWFINDFMHTELAYCALDKGYPRQVNYAPGDFVRAYIKERGLDYKTGDSWGGFLNVWVGQIYCYLVWYYNIPSKRIIQLVSLETIERVYPGTHDLDIDLAAKRIYDHIIKPQLENENNT